MREPGIQGDYTKFVLLAKIWGIPHSTGFPLYLIISGLWWFLPIDPDVFKMALLSSVMVSISIHFIYRIGKLIGFNKWLSLAVALLPATGRSIWQHILIVVICVWSLLKWDITRLDKYIYLAVWAFILGLANHMTILFCLPGMLIFTLISNPRVFLKSKTWIHVGAASVVVLALYSYIFIRSSYFPPVHNEAHINGEFARMIYFLRAGDYAQDWSYYDAAAKKQMWLYFISLARQNLTSIGSIAAILGIIAGALRCWRYSILFILIPTGQALTNFLFHTAEPESYFAVCFLFGAILIGLLAVYLQTKMNQILIGDKSQQNSISNTSMATLVIVVVLIGIGITANIKTNIVEMDLSKPNPEYARTQRILSHIEHPALIYTSHYNYTMLIRYCVNVDGVAESGSVIASQTWNYETANRILHDGSHVYIFADTAHNAYDNFNLLPVNTGIERAELFEFILK